MIKSIALRCRQHASNHHQKCSPSLAIRSYSISTSTTASIKQLLFFTSTPRQQQQHLLLQQQQQQTRQFHRHQPTLQKQEATDAQKLFVEAQDLFQKNELEESIKKYTELLFLVENNAEYNTFEVFAFVLLARSEAYKRIGDFNKAILDVTDIIDKKQEEDVQRSIDLVSSAYLARSKLRVMKGDFALAQEDLDVVVDLVQKYEHVMPPDHADTLTHQCDGLRVMITEGLEQIGQEKLKSITKLNKIQVKELLSTNSDIVVLDVRSRDELKEIEPLPTAVNVPIDEVDGAFKLSGSEFKSKYGFEKPEKTKRILVYCKLGMRAQKAGEALQKVGYQNVLHYSGVADWHDN